MRWRRMFMLRIHAAVREGNSCLCAATSPKTYGGEPPPPDPRMEGRARLISHIAQEASVAQPAVCAPSGRACEHLFAHL